MNENKQQGNMDNHQTESTDIEDGATRIEAYQMQHIPLVKQFNARLKSGNITVMFPESNIPEWLPKKETSNLRQEYFLAFVDGIVRGGYILKYQDFFINGQTTTIADYRLPISEGIINRDFSYLAIVLTTDALNKSTKLFGLGMGGHSSQTAKFIKAMGWRISEIPFHFMILNPFDFLRNITVLRKKALTRFALDLLAYTGIGWVAIKTMHILNKNRLKLGNLSVNRFIEFDEKSDILWNEVKNSYKLIAVRDSKTLNLLYSESRFICLEIFEEKKYIGWVVLLVTQMSAHKQFGAMKVGSIVDCLSDPNNSVKILSCATNYIKKHKPDIIVANHSHFAWNESFKKLGFLEGPSNFLLSVSKPLTKDIMPFDENKNQVYFMRGDGDGPIHL